MALSGNFSTNKYSTSSHGTIGLNLSWTGSQSTTLNRTTIKWTLKSNGTMSSGYYVQGGPITVKINGTTVYSTSSRIDVHGGGGFKKTGTINVNHNTDGSKSVAMSISAALYSASVNCTASKTYTLDKIDRYALLETVENMDDTFSPLPTITYSNRLGPDRVTDIKLRINWTSEGVTQSTDWVELPNDLTATDNVGTYQFTNSTLTTQNRNDMLSACSSATTLAVQYELQSKLDGVVQTHTKSATLVVNIATAKPTWSSQNPLTFRDINSTIVDNITHDSSIIVHAQSTLELSLSAATGNKGATIGGLDTAYSLALNGNTYTFDSSGKKVFIKPSVVGTYTAVVTVTDSRGYKNTTSIDIVVQDWALPTGVCSLTRKDNFYTETYLKVDYRISSVSGTNAVRVWEHHKKVDDASWSSIREITSDVVSSETHTFVFPETGSDILDNDYAYVVQAFVGDLFTTGTIDENNTTLSVYTMSVDKGIPIFFIDILRHGVSVNGFPDEDNQLYVDGTIKSTGKITAENTVFPRYTHLITAEAGTSGVTINTTSWKNIGASKTEDIEAGKYIFELQLSVGYSTSTGRFRAGIKVDDVAYEGVNNVSQPSSAGCINFYGEIEIATSGEHTFQIIGRVDNTGKTVTSASYTNNIILLMPTK